MPEPTFKDRALPLIALGFRVVPLEGKNPCIGGKNWQINASSDPQQINRWDTQFPNANVGIVVGDDHHMWDIEAWEGFAEATQHLPRLDFSGVVQSGSGRGLHIYVQGRKPPWAKTIKNPKYKSKEETPNEKPAFIEFPLMVVAPGSIHPETKRLYKPMEETFTGPKELPKVWFDWLQSQYSTSVTTNTLRSRPLKPGTTLRDILDSTELRGKYEITEQGDKVFYGYHTQLGRCLVKGAPHRDGSNNRQCAFYHMKSDPTDFGHFCLAAKCQVVEGGQRKAALAALGLTLEDVLRPKWRDLFSGPGELDERPLNFIVQRFIQEGGMTGIGGQSGHGKTYTMLSLAKSISTGKKAFGILDTIQSPVLYMLAEGGDRSLNKRLKELRIELSEDFLVRTESKGRALPMDNSGLLAAGKGRVIFMDTLPRWLSGRDENKSTEMAELFQLGQNLLNEGARAIVLAQHSVKPGPKTPFQMTQEGVFRGSGDIVANLACAHGIYQIDNQSRDRTLIHVECVKPRDFEPLPPFQLEGRPWINETGDFRCLKKPGECGWFKDEKRDYLNSTKDASPEDGFLVKIHELEKTMTQAQIGKELNISVATITRLLRAEKAKQRKAAEENEDADDCGNELFTDSETQGE